jgi:hypothetical protein
MHENGEEEAMDDEEVDDAVEQALVYNGMRMMVL